MMESYQALFQEFESIKNDDMDNWTPETAKRCQRLILNMLIFVKNEYELKAFISGRIYDNFNPMANTRNKTLVRPFKQKMYSALDEAHKRLKEIPSDKILTFVKKP